MEGNRGIQKEQYSTFKFDKAMAILKMTRGVKFRFGYFFALSVLLFHKGMSSAKRHCSRTDTTSSGRSSVSDRSCDDSEDSCSDSP